MVSPRHCPHSSGRGERMNREPVFFRTDFEHPESALNTFPRPHAHRAFAFPSPFGIIRYSYILIKIEGPGRPMGGGESVYFPSLLLLFLLLLSQRKASKEEAGAHASKNTFFCRAGPVSCARRHLRLRGYVCGGCVRKVRARVLRGDKRKERRSRVGG